MIHLGIVTTLAFPTLLAAVGAVAYPLRRESAVGVYRLWRDTEFAVGALLTGVFADLIVPRPPSGRSPSSQPDPAPSLPPGYKKLITEYRDNRIGTQRAGGKQLAW